MKDLVVFGAGRIGKRAVREFHDRISYIVDSNLSLVNTVIDGIEVKSVNELIKDKDIYTVLVASMYEQEMVEWLEKNGISNYEMYIKNELMVGLSDTLVENPYISDRKRAVSETDWNSEINIEANIKNIEWRVDRLLKENGLFKRIEIETINRCNGMCDFCPVSKKAETREFAEMSDELFKKIINELAEINYNGGVRYLVIMNLFWIKKLLKGIDMLEINCPMHGCGYLLTGHCLH